MTSIAFVQFLSHGYRRSLISKSVAGCLAIVLMNACTETIGPMSPPPPKVKVMEVAKQDVPIFSEWVGTTDGLVNAKIRSQVNGYLRKQHFREGALVKKGDLLFEIDPRKFQAALDQAAGELKRAEAQYTKTEYDVARNRPLAKEGAISQKELQDSIQMNRAASAAVESARAAREQAELNLDWTRVTAPIDGLIGIAKAHIGDLVSSDDELASISQLDPIRVYFQVSEQEYLKFAELVQAHYQELEEPSQVRDDGHIQMTLSNGKTYVHKGWFFLADREVDVKTGTIRAAALFPNPRNLLRPGLYAKLRAPVAVRQDALLVPQRAIGDLQGRHQVAVVTTENRVEMRPVTVGERIGAQWIILQGLDSGEQVIAEGPQRLKAGTSVHPVPFDTEASATPAALLPRSS